MTIPREPTARGAGERTIAVGEHVYVVTAVSRHGHPLRVTHGHPTGRGSMIEAWTNLALAMHRLKVELREAIPRRLRSVVADPKPFWTER